jgi:transposase InsO family protein
LLIERVLEGGWTAAATAEAAGVSRATVYKWLGRFRGEGELGLRDRSSRPVHSPRQLTGAAEERIVQLRRTRKLGPHRLGALLGVPRSTCYAVLRRHEIQRLDWMDRPTGTVIRRYERERPGELVHVDIKKLARIPDGGGHRMLGRGKDGYTGHSGAGYEFIHAAVDDHSRLAYAEIHHDEQAATCAAFMSSAVSFFAAHGVRVERVLTDNGPGYRSHLFRNVLATADVRQIYCRPYRPQTNGKLRDELFSREVFDTIMEARLLFDDWCDTYNRHRPHSALGYLSPAVFVAAFNQPELS